MEPPGEFVPDASHFDQHFLLNQEIVSRIVTLAEIEPYDTVLEIGPGLGVLTRQLAALCHEVFAIEVDRRLEQPLTELSHQFGNVRIIWGSALDIQFPDFDRLVASLPYRILEPLMEKLVRCTLKRAVLVTGARLGFAVSAGPKRGQWNKLSLLINSYYYPAVAFSIPSSAFSPRPRTTSVVLTLTPRPKSDLLSDQPLFVFREIFEQRDKKLRNALREALIRLAAGLKMVMTKREAKDVLDKLQIESDILDAQFENLSNKQLERLGRILSDLNVGP